MLVAGFSAARAFLAAAPALVDGLVLTLFFAVDVFAFVVLVVDGFFFVDVLPIGMVIGIFAESVGCWCWADAGDAAKRAYRIGAAAKRHARHIDGENIVHPKLYCAAPGKGA